RPPGAGWRVTRSGTRRANGPCPRPGDVHPVAAAGSAAARRQAAGGPPAATSKHHAPGSFHVAHLFQVGAGSGGMPVLDMLCRDPRVTRVTLVEPDVYKTHNVERHLFPHSAVGRLKAELAKEWLKERCPQ